MNCPYCHRPVEPSQVSVKVGDQYAHDRCIQDDAARQSRPFRERVSLDDRGPEPEGKPLKERKERELHE